MARRLPPLLLRVAALCRRTGLWLVALLLTSALPALQAQELQPVPPLSARVIDRTATLDDAQRRALEDKLARFEAAHGTQIAVLMVPSTLPEDIAAYAHRVADSWKIGRREVGDGLLLLVAKDDRRVRIEVAKTLEGAIPDLAASRIINETMVPAFRAGDFAAGIDAGLERLMGLVRGEGLPAPGSGDRTAAPRLGFALQDLAVFLFVGVPVVGAVLTGLFGRKLGSLATGLGVGAIGTSITGSLGLGIAAGLLGLVLILLLGIGAGGRRARRRHIGHAPPIIWGGGGGGWGGGGFGGGGGFSSGGGGDFGGGGASGNW
ncbi:TPM domain-containing protein [Caldimonas tepidiphila]|uniref:TPM domain-containing protein n=1 Tax=Caldimonas tepidiphila TaxID=2315841 RepID=UPI000E5AAC0A|nr:TPM domain-containing protein [Caldimonas tepidiphila]